jgi:hypothetical protein
MLPAAGPREAQGQRPAARAVPQGRASAVDLETRPGKQRRGPSCDSRHTDAQPSTALHRSPHNTEMILPTNIPANIALAEESTETAKPQVSPTVPATAR